MFGQAGHCLARGADRGQSHLQQKIWDRVTQSSGPAEHRRVRRIALPKRMESSPLARNPGSAQQSKREIKGNWSTREDAFEGAIFE
jgi:hypothetical protein